MLIGINQDNIRIVQKNGLVEVHYCNNLHIEAGVKMSLKLGLKIDPDLRNYNLVNVDTDAYHFEIHPSKFLNEKCICNSQIITMNDKDEFEISFYSPSYTHIKIDTCIAYVMLAQNISLNRFSIGEIE